MKYPAVRRVLCGVVLSASIACSARAEVPDHAVYRFAFDRADKELKIMIRTTGVAGMESDIQGGYRGFDKSKSEATLIYCYALHRVASDLDGAFSAATNLDAQDPALTRGAATVRAIRAPGRLGYIEERSYHKRGAWEPYGFDRTLSPILFRKLLK